MPPPGRTIKAVLITIVDAAVLLAAAGDGLRSGRHDVRMVGEPQGIRTTRTKELEDMRTENGGQPCSQTPKWK
jgi:hypothetical protein